jgi:hypothetical protein
MCCTAQYCNVKYAVRTDSSYIYYVQCAHTAYRKTLQLKARRFTLRLGRPNNQQIHEGSEAPLFTDQIRG